MRFIFIYFIFTTFGAVSQNTESISWDLNFVIENVSADSDELKIYSLSFFPISSSKNTYYLKDNKLVHISLFDSVNHIRTVMLKGENHSHVFTTLDGVIYYEKAYFSNLGFDKYDKSLINESFPSFKFIEHKQLGPFNCVVNEIILPEQNFQATITSTNDIQVANSLIRQIPISKLQNLGFLLDFKMDLGFLKIKMNCTNFQTFPVNTSIFSISTKGINEIDSQGEIKLMKLMFGSDYLNELEEVK